MAAPRGLRLLMKGITMLSRPVPLPDVPMGDRIPRVLHQHYFPGEAALPSPIRAVRDSLRDRNPGWTYKLWDLAAAEEFISGTYGDAVLRRFRRISPEYYAARSDLLRYLNIYAEGGVYLDIKSTCDRPLDEAIVPEDRFLLLHFPHFMAAARTPAVHKEYSKAHPDLVPHPNGEFVQWVIVSVPGHPYLRRVIECVLRRIDTYTPFTHGVGSVPVVRMTGPVAYTHVIHKMRNQHAHSGPMSISDRGFVFSGFGDQHSHQKINPQGATHYSRLGTPILQSSKVTQFMTRAMNRTRYNARMKRAWDAFHYRMSRLWPT
jgi:inositol phosphorylceramide mannosyltransferase catalytic subunit